MAETALGLFEWMDFLPSITFKPSAHDKFVRRSAIVLLKSPPIEATHSYNRLKCAFSVRELWKVEPIAAYIGKTEVSLKASSSSFVPSSSSSSLSSSSSSSSPSSPPPDQAMPTDFLALRDTHERLACRIRMAGGEVLWWSVQPIVPDAKRKNVPEV